MRNAQQYLFDFAKSQENWFKALIYSAIDTNGDILPEKYKEIINSIITETEINLTEPNIVDSEENQSIQFKNLKHVSGVNALAANQTIKFNKDLTILYGMNGAGKSGYFKVLNEIVGGNQQKSIISNIYSNEARDINVEIKYLINGSAETTIEWNGQTRAIPELNRCKVFDSSYLNGLLETRKSDQTLIQPLGLNLFTYLVDLLDDTKNDLISYADKIRTKKPIINLESFSDELKSIFNNHTISKSSSGKINKLFDFSDEDDDLLKKIEQDIKDIKQINIQDKIKLLKNNQKEIEDTKKNLKKKSTTLSELIKNVESNIKLYKNKEALNKEAKSRFEVLKSIPENDSQQWKDFISAGDKYTTVIGNKIDLCPYCRQPLKDDISISIVKSYSSYLKDSSELELKKANDSINSLVKRIELFIPEISLSQNIIDEINDIKISGVMIFDQISTIIENFKTIIKELQASIRSKEIKNHTEIINSKLIIDELDKKISSYQTKIDVFSKEETDKKETLIKLNDQLEKLKENKSISDQKEVIKKWIEETVKENSIRKKEASISSRKLSNLSKNAHNELLTESLKLKFNDELSKLGYSNLTVSLENAGIRKGISSTKLVIEKDNDIKSILSEGEQKAVALALFISEIMLQKSNYPVILDDPVNSLDHKIAANFAYRLMELDTQIILLNHNRLFLDAFETSKENHICKTTDTVCNNQKGKHIKIYEVFSQGKMSKGILRNYKGNYARNHIKSAKHLLTISPFEEAMKVANLIRIAVECIIDEIIFNHQIPTKYSNKNSRINWADLKKINKDDSVIDSLQSIHGRASGGEMHNGTERNENPIEVDEFNEMITNLEVIMGNAR